jgi:hypothetical protein
MMANDEEKYISELNADINKLFTLISEWDQFSTGVKNQLHKIHRKVISYEEKSEVNTID